MNRHQARGVTACGAVFGTGSWHDACGGSRGEIQTTPFRRGRPFRRASKVRAAKFTKPKAWSSFRRGGFAARDSFKQDSGSHAGAIIPCHTSSFGNHQSSESESRQSRDSDSPETFLKKSSSRWADRPIPVLQVKFPNPWRILADSPKNLKWSGRRDSNSGPLEPHSSALPGCATPRQNCGTWIRDGREFTSCRRGGQYRTCARKSKTTKSAKIAKGAEWDLTTVLTRIFHIFFRVFRSQLPFPD